MNTQTLTRADLVDAAVRYSSLQKHEVALLLRSFFRILTGELETGSSIKISSFGSFLVRQKKSRMGRNPKTGDDAVITARRVVVFKPSNILKHQVEKSFSAVKGGVQKENMYVSYPVARYQKGHAKSGSLEND
jgi:integration host factor subunit alpha